MKLIIHGHQFLFLIAGLIVIFSVPYVFAQSNSVSESTPCDEVTTQMQMNACWAAAAHDADRDLKAELDQTVRRVAGFSSKKMDQLLHDAQQNWARYRDLQCALEASRSEGGSVNAVEKLACRWRLARARTQELGQIRAMWSR